MDSVGVTDAPKTAALENAAHPKVKAMRRLLDEVQKGWDSVEGNGWVSEEDACRQLGVGE